MYVPGTLQDLFDSILLESTLSHGAIHQSPILTFGRVICDSFSENPLLLYSILLASCMPCYHVFWPPTTQCQTPNDSVSSHYSRNVGVWQMTYDAWQMTWHMVFEILHFFGGPDPIISIYPGCCHHSWPLLGSPIVIACRPTIGWCDGNIFFHCLFMLYSTGMAAS